MKIDQLQTPCYVIDEKKMRENLEILKKVQEDTGCKILLAQKAGAAGEVPVGAVIVKDGKVIAVGENRRERTKNALGHAEIEAIDKACRALGTWRLDGCELYVTLEPCPMCAGAIVNSRISKVVFGAFDPAAGAVDSVTDTVSLFRPGTEVWAGIEEDRCKALLTGFFKNIRE